MALVRLWFITLMAAVILREQPLETIIEDTWEPVQPTEAQELPKILEIPEYEFFSFLDQETGTWKKEYK